MSTRSFVHRATFILASLLLVGANFVSPAAANSLNQAAALRWPAYIDTDLQFAEFFATSHTVMTRFMPQYPKAYRGPLLTVSPTGTYPLVSYQLSLGDFFNDGQTKSEKLVLEVGGETKTYLLPSGLPAGVWQHVAVVRSPRLVYDGGLLKLHWFFSVYLNGQKLCVWPSFYTCLELEFATSPDTPAGTLRVGRTNPLRSGSDQFYGLVDDVAVFKKALSAAEIGAIYSAQPPLLTGQEPGLLAGYTFDTTTPSGGPLPPQLSRPTQLKFGAVLTYVSDTRDSNQDRDDLPLPLLFAQPALHLPFKPGQAWKVIQGYASGGSHSGTSAFSLDLVLGLPQQAGQQTVGKYLPNVSYYPYASDPSCGEPVHASAAGEIVQARDDGGAPEDTSDPQGDSINNDYDGWDLVRVDHDPSLPDDVSSYMHLLHGSVTAEFGKVLAAAPNFTVSPPVPVSDGQQIGAVGTRNGCHLHTGLRNGSVTRPAAYWSYEACDAQKGKDCTQSGNWDWVVFGTPVEGQMVRNPSAT
jgi:Concanavalin A-like lectin/glucanases superfamily